MSEKSFEAEDYGDEADADYGSEVDVVSDNEELAGDEGGARRGVKRIPDSERITTRFMTKYERARILGTRAL